MLRGLLLLLFQGQLIGNIILIYIADVGNGFLSDILRNFKLNVPEPLIRVQPILLRLLAKACNPIGARVVTGKCEEGLVERVNRWIIKYVFVILRIILYLHPIRIRTARLRVCGSYSKMLGRDVTQVKLSVREWQV